MPPRVTARRARLLPTVAYRKCCVLYAMGYFERHEARAHAALERLLPFPVLFWSTIQPDGSSRRTPV
jgi:hypothetical protein